MNKLDFKNFPFFLSTYIIFIFIMFIYPLFISYEYSILKHTVSLLGAQNAPFSWIMNLTFVLIGASFIFESFFKLNRFLEYKLLFILIGTSIICVGIFNNKSLIPSLPYNLEEDLTHFFFAYLTGYLFLIFNLSIILIEKNKKIRLIALLIIFIILFIFILMVFIRDLRGILERIMFLISMGWLIYFSERKRKESLKSSS